MNYVLNETYLLFFGHTGLTATTNGKATRKVKLHME